MFSMLISIISMCLIIMLTMTSVAASGAGIDWGSVVAFAIGIVSFVFFVWGFFWGIKKILGGIPNFWDIER